MSNPPRQTSRKSGHFGDLVELVRDKYMQTLAAADVPCINLENISEGSGRITGWSKSSDNLSTKTSFQAGDILFSKLRPYLRKYAQPRFRGVCTSELLAFRAKSGVDPRYVYQVVGSPAFIGHCVASSFGTKMPRTDWKSASSFAVQIPVEAEQRRIAELLSAVDEQIALIADQQLKHGELCRAVETRLFDMAANVGERRSIGSLAHVGGGKRLPHGHDYSELATPLRYLRVTDFFGQFVDMHSLKSLRQKTFNAIRRYELHAGDVYISIAGSIGWAGVMPKHGELNVILTENAARLRLADGKISSEYLALFINSQQGQYQIAERVGTGGGVPKLALERIRTIQVPVPGEREQKRIVDTMSALQALSRIFQKELEKLVLIKQGLLNDLIAPVTA